MSNDAVPHVLREFGKQPGEIVPNGRWIQSFAPDCVAQESIVSATVAITRVDGVATTADDLAAGMPSIDGVRVTARFTKGLNGVDYKVKWQATSSAGAVYEADWSVRVVEV